MKQPGRIRCELGYNHHMNQPSNDVPDPRLAEKIAATGADRIRRHIFLCCDQKKPKCCSLEEGLASWDFLKDCLQERRFSEGE